MLIDLEEILGNNYNADNKKRQIVTLDARTGTANAPQTKMLILKLRWSGVSKI